MDTSLNTTKEIQHEFNELYNIILEFQSDKRRSYKTILMEKYKENKLFCEFFRFLFDKTAITNISLTKFNQGFELFQNNKDKSLENLYPRSFKEFIQALKNSSGKITDLIIIHGYIQYFLEDAKKIEVLRAIASKKIKIGVGEKTVSNIFPEMIIDYNVMTAKDYYKQTISDKTEIFITTKYDGIRMIIIIGYDGEIILRSREGKIIIWNSITESIESLIKSGDLKLGTVLDGEVLANNKERIDNFLLTQSCLMTDSQSKRKNLIYVVFDILTYKEFLKESEVTYSNRRKKLEAINLDKINNIIIAPILYKGKYDSEIVEKVLKTQIALGEEGVMINLGHAVYEKQRTSSLLKVKKFNDINAEIIEINKATYGKYKGLMGSVKIRCTHENGSIIILNVGSGWKNVQRLDMIKNPKFYIGKTIVVKFLDFTKTSLRFPIFTGKFLEL